ncbi:hypothetical protein JVT61DRAFT_11038 [Boletus reticuloceps]|uniref:Uncharacterized protein n=1 Tax=Boletus reticuloceps TaxID=495285 RepID=A0A8I2YFF1_9AGAM|nr:hypothetical protein JVT61DRAFT_11038 [Boletus reticuloceps]
MKFTTTTVSPTCLLEQALGFTESSQIVSPTSQAVYPFNAPNGAYIVKLLNSRPADFLLNWTRPTSPSSTALSHSRLTMTGAPSALFAKRTQAHFRPKATLEPHRIPIPDIASPGGTLKGFPRPREPSSCRPLVDKANAQAVASPPQPVPLSGTTVTATFPTSRSSHGPSRSASPESPRSKLAHVLTTNAQPQVMRRTRQQARVPLLVKGVEVSIDPRTQCGIEGLKVEDGERLVDDELDDEMDEFGYSGLDQVLDDDGHSGDEDALGPENGEDAF